MQPNPEKIFKGISDDVRQFFNVKRLIFFNHTSKKLGEGGQTKDDKCPTFLTFP